MQTKNVMLVLPINKLYNPSRKLVIKIEKKNRQFDDAPFNDEV